MSSFATSLGPHIAGSTSLVILTGFPAIRESLMDLYTNSFWSIYIFTYDLRAQNLSKYGVVVEVLGLNFGEGTFRTPLLKVNQLRPSSKAELDSVLVDEELESCL